MVSVILLLTYSILNSTNLISSNVLDNMSDNSFIVKPTNYNYKTSYCSYNNSYLDSYSLDDNMDEVEVDVMVDVMVEEEVEIEIEV